MLKQQLIDYTIKKLTGGGIVTLNLSPDIIDEILDDVLEIVSSWFVEDLVVETVPVVFNTEASQGTSSVSRNGYISTNSFSYPIHYIDTILPIRQHAKGGYLLEEISDLLGLPAGLFTSDSVISYATWLSTRAMIRKSMSLKMRWKHIPSEEKVYLHKVPTESNQQVSVFYFPLPEKLRDVSFGPALNWIKKRFLFELQLAWSTVMLKASPDPATVSFANTIRSEANAAIEKSDTKLESLQFIYTSFQRN